jgi:hypothetical protein
MSKLNISFQGVLSDLSRKYWHDAKKKNKLIESKCQIGKKIDAVEKLLTPIKKITEIFPLDTEQSDWMKKALKLKANKSSYTTPAINALTNLMSDINSELARKERANEITKLGTQHPLKKIHGFAMEQRTRIMDFIKAYESEAIPLIEGRSQNGYRFTFSKNLTSLISGKFKSKNFAITGGNVGIELSLVDMGGDNPFVIQFFQEGLTDVVDEAVEEIVDLMQEYEKRLKSFAGKGLIIEKILRGIKIEGQGEIDAIISRLNKDLPLEVDKLHEKMQKMKNSYKIYKKKVVVKIAKTSFEVLLSAAGTGVSAAGVATGGGAALGIAGLVLSCRSLFKSATALGQAVQEASKSATKIGKEVQASLKKQADEFRKEAVSMSKKDAAKVIINNITDFAAGLSFTKTIKDLIEKCDTWLNKTYGVFENCRKLAKSVNACIGTAEILNKKIEEKSNALKKNPPSDEKQRKKAKAALEDAQKKLEKLRTDLALLLDKISSKDFYSNIRNAEKSMGRLKSLQQLRQQTISPNFDKIVAFIRIAADAIDTIAGSVVGGFDFASSEKTALDIAGAALGGIDAVNGLAGSGVDIKENL